MPSATVTSKGQVTIPKIVRDSLDLQPGDRVDFVIEQDGKVILRQASLQIEELAGILKRPGKRPISVETMNQAIRQRGGRK